MTPNYIEFGNHPQLEKKQQLWKQFREKLLKIVEKLPSEMKYVGTRKPSWKYLK